MSETAGWKPAMRRSCSRSLLLPALVLVAFLIGGCGTLKNGRGWGQDALWPVDLERVGRAACDAFFNPRTLVPLAGAALFAIDDFDERVSDWASEHNPVFGSQNGAADASNYLSDILYAEGLATALATPGGDTPEAWATSKLKGGAVELGAIMATSGLTDLLKQTTGRVRPDRSDEESFPSGHTSHAFAFATLANRNLRSLDNLEDIRPALEIGNAVLASSVAWARVEAHKHYPSDVLVGAALGYFVTTFLHDAFMNLPDDRFDFAVFPLEGGAAVSLCFRF